MLCDDCEARELCQVHKWRPCEKVGGGLPVKPHPTYMKRLKMIKKRDKLTVWMRRG